MLISQIRFLMLTLLMALSTATEANAMANVTLEPMLDGHLIRCEEGGDTLGNPVAYIFQNASVKFNPSSNKIILALRTVYQRCQLVNGKATLVTPINPFSPYTYKFPYINEKGEKVVVKVTTQYTALQILAMKHDIYESKAKSKVASVNAFNGQAKSLTFEVVLNAADFLNPSEMQALNSGKDATVKAVLLSTAQSRGSEEFMAGGSYVLTLDITKARNSKENILKASLQRSR